MVLHRKLCTFMDDGLCIWALALVFLTTLVFFKKSKTLRLFPNKPTGSRSVVVLLEHRTYKPRTGRNSKRVDFPQHYSDWVDL